MKSTKTRDETAWVCIIERKTNNGAEFLLTQRPKTGLLASLWQFPQIDLPRTETEDQFSLEDGPTIIDTYLVETIQVFVDRNEMAKRSSIGTIYHQFSHINQTYIVEHVIVDKDKCLQRKE